MTIVNNNTKFQPLSDSNLSDEEVMDIYGMIRFVFEQSHPNNMVDASDAYILTVFPFKRGDKMPAYYDVINYETGLLEGEPALRKIESNQEIMVMDDSGNLNYRP